jgi:hypothetical protein
MDAEVTEATATATADRGLLVGGVVLLSVGTVLVFAGALVTGGVAMRSTRRWMRQWEEPPRVVARRRLGQARSAVSAGARSWRENGSPARPANLGAES